MTSIKFDDASSSTAITNNTDWLSLDQLWQIFVSILLYPNTTGQSVIGAQPDENLGLCCQTSSQMSDLEYIGKSPQRWHGLSERGLTIHGSDSSGVSGCLGAQLLQALIGNYIQYQGQYGTFSFVNPSDKSATGST
jgi:hypothetical protein